MGTGITDVIGGPHDFLPPRSDRSDEFQKLWVLIYWNKNDHDLGHIQLYKAKTVGIVSRTNVTLCTVYSN
jgi:hypothetical protein